MRRRRFRAVVDGLASQDSTRAVTAVDELVKLQESGDLGGRESVLMLCWFVRCRSHEVRDRVGAGGVAVAPGCPADALHALRALARVYEQTLRQLQRGELYPRDVYFQEADLRDVYLREADLRGLYLEGFTGKVVLDGADLRGADLRGTRLGWASLERADLTGARMDSRSDLAHANLTYANLAKARLPRASFYYANLRSACFQEAYLHGARFDGAHLNEADFTGASLERADFTRAEVYDADFTGTIYHLQRPNGSVGSPRALLSGVLLGPLSHCTTSA